METDSEVLVLGQGWDRSKIISIGDIEWAEDKCSSFPRELAPHTQVHGQSTSLIPDYSTLVSPRESHHFLKTSPLSWHKGTGALRIMNKTLGHMRKLYLALSTLNYVLGMWLLLNLKNFQGYY